MSWSHKPVTSIGKEYLSNSPEVRAIHAWARKWKPKPSACENCGKEGMKLQLSNVDHKYRKVLSDYNYFCTYCHAQYDYQIGLRRNITKAENPNQDTYRKMSVRQQGDKCYLWKGGISPRYKRKHIDEFIAKKDKNVCPLCRQVVADMKVHYGIKHKGVELNWIKN